MNESKGPRPELAHLSLRDLIDRSEQGGYDPRDQRAYSAEEVVAEIMARLRDARSGAGDEQVLAFMTEQATLNVQSRRLHASPPMWESRPVTTTVPVVVDHVHFEVTGETYAELRKRAADDLVGFLGDAKVDQVEMTMEIETSSGTWRAEVCGTIRPSLPEGDAPD